MEKKNLIIITALVIGLILLSFLLFGKKIMFGQMNLSEQAQSAGSEEKPVPFFDRPQNQGKPVVTIKDGAFDPATITVKKDGSAIWVNRDVATRSIRSDYFNVSRIPANGTAEMIFSEVGTFEYHCGSNPSMKGTVIVEE
ncbi:MAG: cupredoxin domain-containing protein [Candidatus Paceibacterota bacterium]|jgi:plastocyanin